MISGRTSCSGAPGCYPPLVDKTCSRERPVSVRLTHHSPGMAHKKQRGVLNANAVFSVQRMRTVMPIFWDVTRRVRPTLRRKK